MVPDPTSLLDHWGYLAIFLVVVLGNVGLPVPEETILLLAGYLVWEGSLRLVSVLVIGVVSAAAGDNLGYWLGRRYGRAAIERHAAWLLGSRARLGVAREFILQHGSRGVVLARFVPGLRFAAGPLAGLLGLPFRTFFVANLLGASTYVPVVVGAGYAVGYGLGDYLARFERAVAEIEHVVLVVAAVVTVTLVVWRVRKGRAKR